MATLTSALFFRYFRKFLAIILISFSIITLFFTIINAETWFFGEKYNGDKARLIIFPICISAICIGAAQWKNIIKSDMFVVGWFIVVFFWYVGNRLCGTLASLPPAPNI